MLQLRELIKKAARVESCLFFIIRIAEKSRPLSPIQTSAFE